MFALGVLSAMALTSLGVVAATESNRPNIIIVLVDDMGYADTQAYGSEIETPNLESLAKSGVRFTQFHNCALCSPTRGSLMTGLYPQQAGMSHLPNISMNPEGRKDGPGELDIHSVTIAEVMKSAGYATYMSGKWHLTAQLKATTDAAKFGWPRQRGFDRFFGFIPGTHSYWKTEGLVSDNAILRNGQIPEGSYLTDLIAEYASTFIADHAKSSASTPFFLYLAFNAPHWEITAKPEDIEHYKDTYTIGWDALRQQRFAKQKKVGVIPPTCELSPRNERIPAWDSLKPEQKSEYALSMATYAGMITCMDRGVGRVLAALDATKLRDNTLIFFLSDNGACAERTTSVTKDKDGHFGGRIGPGWANAANTPLRYWKSTTWEGGTATELILNWPKGIPEAQRGTINHQVVGHVMDLMPTCVELAKANYPATFKGNTIQPMEGLSLVPTMSGKSIGPRELFWKCQSNDSVRSGSWKMTRNGGREWELFDLSKDPSEIHDIAKENPEVVKGLDAKWQAWADRVHADVDEKGIKERKRN